MSVHWMKLAGDTSRFAISVAFVRDPDDGAGATADEAASWGGLQLWVDGQNLCAHTASGETTSSVYWYLLPFLEWVAENWDALFHEERLPLRVAGADAVSSLSNTRFPFASLAPEQALEWEETWQGWWRRHALEAARDGGVFPQVVFRRWRDDVEVGWQASRLAGVPNDVAFEASGGVARLNPVEVTEPLYEVLREAVSYLLDELPASERLQELSRAVERLITGEQAVQRFAWLAGLGWDTTGVVQGWRAIEERMAQAPFNVRDALFGADVSPLVVARGPAVAQMFGTIAPNVTEADVAAIVELLADLVADEPEAAVLQGLVREEPLDPELSAAEQGYALALEVLHHVGVPEDDWVDVEGILDRLGVRRPVIELSDPKIRGLAVAGERFAPAAAVNAAYPWTGPGVRRATLAHEFCHLLFDRSRGRQVAVASGPWAPLDIERRAGAFAAMFLMPTGAVRRAVREVGGVWEEWESVLAVAARLRTSPSSTLEHLHNLGFVDDLDYDRLRDVDARRRPPAADA